MPIRIDNDLPAKAVLEEENVFVMDKERACTQDIRPLKIAILNLMPNKLDTELHLLRSLSNTPLQLDITFLQTESYVPTHVSESHMEKFYNYFSEIKDKRFDGLIITGAPVELKEFEEVDYWDEVVDHGMVQDTCHINFVYLLGSTSRTLLSLWNQETYLE